MMAMGPGITYHQTILNTLQPLEYLAIAEQIFFDDTYTGHPSYLYPVKIQAERDMTFVTLTFDLSRVSSEPLNIRADPPVGSRQGIYNSPVPERVSNLATIKFSELQTKLNQGLDVYL